MGMLTKPEIAQYIDHYNVYKTLPVEVMEQLFAAAVVVAAMADPSGKVMSDLMAEPAPAEAKPKRTAKKGE